MTVSSQTDVVSSPVPAARATDVRETRAQLRVAIVGAGKMGRHHAAAISRLGASAHVTAVADPTASARDAMLRLSPSAAAFPSLDELLESQEVDVVHVCTAPQTHEALATQALEAGCHVYVEKPFAPTTVEADRMLPLAAERGGNPEDPGKDDPLDFVLWQRSAPGEPWWESPWGRGRPGWHIECSTMARRLLGQPVDIHGGGTDLIFPHHESELAQAEALPGERPFVRHWVHTGQVFQGGEKMSKSLGNLVFVHDLLDRHDPLVVRRFLLRRRYSEDWDFAESQLDREGEPKTVPAGDGSWAGDADRAAFFNAMDENMNTPAALAIYERAAASSDPEARAFADEAREILGLWR